MKFKESFVKNEFKIEQNILKNVLDFGDLDFEPLNYSYNFNKGFYKDYSSNSDTYSNLNNASKDIYNENINDSVSLRNTINQISYKASKERKRGKTWSCF